MAEGEPGRRVFVTGGSGFVGSAVLEELASRGHEVHALVRGRPPAAGGPRARTFAGDLFDTNALDAGMAGCDTVIHLVGIIREKLSEGVTFRRTHVDGTRSVIDAAGRAGVGRFVHMSALGTRADAPSVYHRTKYEAEEYVRASGLDWTIIRPSMIHGPGGEFMREVAKWARGTAPPFLFMPYFGRGVLGLGGAGRLQPVFVGDVARAFTDALGNPKTVGQIYAIGGAQVVTWPEFHRTAAAAIVGRRRPVLPLPAWKATLLTRLLPAALLPFNRDQVLMSQEDNTCDLTDFRRDFGWEPQGFESALRAYAKGM